MLRASESPLKVEDNESCCPDQKEEASLPLPREQASCTVTKSRATGPSKKENVTDGSQTRAPKRALKCPEGDLCHPQGSDVSREPPLPWHTKGEFNSPAAAPLGNDFCTPERHRVEGKAAFGVCEQPKSPVDFAAVLSAEFGVAQEGSARRPTETSPRSLKFKRRSTVGLRGSPENSTLIRYLTQQRSSRQREPFTQISPFNPGNVRSLKDKIVAFQASLESLQEAEGESSQGGGSCSVCQLCACSAVPRCEHSGPAAGSALECGSQTPGTALGSTPSSEPCHSSSLLRSILKKTPGKEPRDSPKESSNSATDRGGGGESAVVSSCVKTSGTLQTDTAATLSSKPPKKKKVTFGQLLSPELFDHSLPANTPLRRGASPGCPQSPWAVPGFPQEPLPLLDFGWHEEGVEPLPEPLEPSVAAEPPPPVENAEAAETAKPDRVRTRSSTKRKQGPGELQEQQVPAQVLLPVPQQGPSSARDPQNSPRSQRQRKPSTAAAQRSQKTKYPSYGRRRKKKGKKAFYGERETVSKKPLLSPIPEIPEVSSAVSSPNSPEADSLWTEALGDPRLLQEAAATSSGQSGSLEPAPAAQFSHPVPDAAGDADPPEHFQQAEDTPCEKAAKASSSLLEQEELQRNLPGLQLLEHQEGPQSTKSPQKDSPKRRRRRRRSSSAFSLPAVEALAVPGADVCSYSLEEALAVPQGRAVLRVRRSMRLSQAAASEGLAWIQLPQEQLPALPKGRRSSNISILAGAENLRPRQPNLLPVAAPGKENKGSAPPLAAAPGTRRRRREEEPLGAPETLWAPTHRRRSTRSEGGKDSRGQSHSEAAETLQPRLKDVTGISGFLK